MNTEKVDNYIQIGLLIIAFASVFSPVIVTIINSIHDTHLKKLENINKVKQEVLSEFSKNVTSLFGSQYYETEFYQSLNKVYIYFNVDEKLINKLITDASKMNNVEFNKLVNQVIRDLSKQLKYK
nr:MAG TPA: hypothetical protein [Caudoviricetes sp.]